VPVIGLLAIGAASALVALAPNILFPAGTERGLHFSPPRVSGEVARVSAPPAPATRRNAPGSGQPVPTSRAPVVDGATGAAVLAGKAVDGATASKGGRPLFRSGDDDSRDSARTQTGITKNSSNGLGKAKGHSKTKSQGKANGHYKPRHHDKPNAHSRKKRG
jgi:hypothetical protein